MSQSQAFRSALVHPKSGAFSPSCVIRSENHHRKWWLGRPCIFPDRSVRKANVLLRVQWDRFAVAAFARLQSSRYASRGRLGITPATTNVLMEKFGTAVLASTTLVSWTAASRSAQLSSGRRSGCRLQRRLGATPVPMALRRNVPRRPAHGRAKRTFAAICSRVISNAGPSPCLHIRRNTGCPRMIPCFGWIRCDSTRTSSPTRET